MVVTEVSQKTTRSVMNRNAALAQQTQETIFSQSNDEDKGTGNQGKASLDSPHEDKTPVAPKPNSTAPELSLDLHNLGGFVEEFQTRGMPCKSFLLCTTLYILASTCRCYWN